MLAAVIAEADCFAAGKLVVATLLAAFSATDFSITEEPWAEELAGSPFTFSPLAFSPFPEVGFDPTCIPLRRSGTFGEVNTAWGASRSGASSATGLLCAASST
jgi:hypothetical protein